MQIYAENAPNTFGGRATLGPAGNYLCAPADSLAAIGERLLLKGGRDMRDCETVGIPPLMSRKTLGILDGGRASIARGGVGVLKVWIRAEHNILDC